MSPHDFAAQPIDSTRIEGRLHVKRLAPVLVSQFILSVFVAGLTGLGVMCLSIFWNPKNLIASPSVFLWLGMTLLTLAGLGFYYRVVRYWSSCAYAFKWDGERLVYRTVFSRRIHEYRLEDIVSVSARRGYCRGEDGSTRLVRFDSGRQLRLQVGPLDNAERLFVQLKSAVDRLAYDDSMACEAVPTPDHPQWPAIQPHLEVGESVQWLGRPVSAKLWSEISAEVVFGLIPGAFAFGLLTLGGHLTLTAGIRSGAAPISIGSLFACLAIYLVAAPWRIRKMLRDTVYAVTDRRVILLHGLTWGSQATVQRDPTPLRMIPQDQARLFERADNQRDILLGGEWRRGRKGARYWVHYGLLASDDPHGAERAIRRLGASQCVDGSESSQSESHG